VQTSVHLERKSVSLWKYTSHINVQRKCPDLQFLAAVGHIAVCTTRLKIWWLFSSDYWVCGQWVCVVEVTACSLVVCLNWWVTDDKIVLSVLNMFTYCIVEGNW